MAVGVRPSSFWFSDKIVVLNEFHFNEMMNNFCSQTILSKGSLRVKHRSFNRDDKCRDIKYDVMR